MESFRAKLIATTNEKIKKYEGEIRECYIDNVLLMIKDNGHYIRTSTIDEVKEENNFIHVKTLNSVYTLERVD